MNLARKSFNGTMLPAAVLALVSCTSEPDLNLVGVESTPPPTDAVEQVVSALATGAVDSGDEIRNPLSAEITEVIDGGPAGEWAVQVQFPNGTGDGCYVDVYDKRSEKLLARDEVNDSPDRNTSHQVRFRYRGSITNLTIRVTERNSGAVLAETEHR